MRTGSEQQTFATEPPTPLVAGVAIATHAYWVSVRTACEDMPPPMLFSLHLDASLGQQHEEMSTCDLACSFTGNGVARGEATWCGVSPPPPPATWWCLQLTLQVLKVLIAG